MTDDEKLQEYVRHGAKPQQRQPKQVVTPNRPVAKPLSALKYYRKLIRKDLTYLTVSVVWWTFVFCLSIKDEATATAVLLGGVALQISITMFLVVRLQRYQRWIDGKYYPLRGWHEFFEKRSPGFWKERNYTVLRIRFVLGSQAQDLHRQAITTFVRKRIQKWNRRYEKIEWESGYGKPKDLTSDGMGMHGEFSRVELPRLIRMLTVQFRPLAKLLGNNLVGVVLESNSKEETYRTKKLEYDAYERQSQRGL